MTQADLPDDPQAIRNRLGELQREEDRIVAAIDATDATQQEKIALADEFRKVLAEHRRLNESLRAKLESLRAE